MQDVAGLNSAATQNNKTKQKAKPKQKLKAISKISLIKYGVGLLGLILIANSFYIHAKAYTAQVLLERAWQQRDATKPNQVNKPWPWFDSYPVAKINFPSLDKEQIVIMGDSGQALAFGPGLNALSVNPGEPGSIVVSGHRDTHFEVLQYLNPSEEIIIETMQGEKHRYKISNIEVININETEIVQTDDERLLLVTCYPFDADSAGTPYRYVIEALPEPKSVAGIELNETYALRYQF